MLNLVTNFQFHFRSGYIYEIKSFHTGRISFHALETGMVKPSNEGWHDTEWYCLIRHRMKRMNQFLRPSPHLTTLVVQQNSTENVPFSQPSPASWYMKKTDAAWFHGHLPLHLLVYNTQHQWQEINSITVNVTGKRHGFIHTITERTPHHHHHFMALFPGQPGWAGARRELLDFMVQGEINRGRHTDHPAGRHSIRTLVVQKELKVWKPLPRPSILRTTTDMLIITFRVRIWM